MGQDFQNASQDIFTRGKMKYERSLYYFARVGYNIPIGSFAKQPSPDLPVYDHVSPFSDNKGLGAKPGLAYELGVAYTFKYWQPLQEQNIKLWWYITAFRYSTNSFSWANRGGIWADSVSYDNDFIFLSLLKFGPGFTYFLNDKVFLCGFYQLDPSYSSVIVQDHAGFPGPWKFKMDGEGVGLRHSLGITMSAYGAQFTLDWNFGNINYQFTHDYQTWVPSTTGQGGGWLDTTDYIKTKTRTSTVTFTLGLMLGKTVK